MQEPFSVPKIWVPTQFQTLDTVDTQRTNLAGCENYRVSPRAISAISSPESGWLRDHWLAQDATLRQLIAGFHGVTPQQVFLTSGAIGGIRYAFEIFTRPGAHVGLLRPDWPGFRFFAEHGRTRIAYADHLDYPFTFRQDDLVDFARRFDLEFVIFSNPSAVTGTLWEPDEIEQLLVACPTTMFVVDEADAIYPRLSAADLVQRYDNVIFLNSFSKFYGLSGLRIGYVVAPLDHVQHFERTVNPAELASISIVAAREAFQDTQFQDETQHVVEQNLRKLSAAVRSPLRLIDGSRCFAAYLWADATIEDPKDYLDRHGIDVVPGPLFGIDRGGRINLANPDAIDTLIACITNSTINPVADEPAVANGRTSV